MSAWWRSAAVYQVYPRSFSDGNGDGLGDLLGVIDRLPYLAGLGVDAIWLCPFYPSPLRDSGYDVADPRGVDPIYGTLNDAQRLIDEAHACGLRVIVDVVPNHASSERPWFLQALSSGPGSPERARFHVLDGRGRDGERPPNNWVSWFGGSAWTRIREADGEWGQWYLHTFDSSQPDLNWSNPEVVEDGLATLRFWLDRGVDGFRVDVALGLAKDMTYPDLEDPQGLSLAMRMDLDDGSAESMARRAKVANSPVLDRDEVQEVYRGWRAVMDAYPGDRMAVAEAWVPPERAARYVAPDTLHQIFNFDFMAVPFDAGRIVGVIERTMEGLRPVGAPATWALSNHDTPRVVTRLGGGEQGRRRARALALIAHVLPGSVYVYQGEELALEDAELPDDARRDPVWFRSEGREQGRDGARVPLPWTGSEPPYGFTARADSPLWLPQPSDWAPFSVDAQTGDPLSALEQYRSMLHLRRTHPGLAEGALFEVARVSDEVVVITRGYGLVCIVNCGGEPMIAPMRGTVLVASDGSVLEAEGSVVVAAAAGAWLQT